MTILAQINWANLINWDKLKDPVTAIKIVVLIGLGFPLVALASRAVTRIPPKRMSPQGIMLLRKAIFYLGLVNQALTIRS